MFCFRFVLNTSIELPHDVGVNALLFQPGDPFGEQIPLVVTTGKDERFKLWSMIEPTSVYSMQTLSHKTILKLYQLQIKS